MHCLAALIKAGHISMATALTVARWVGGKGFNKRFGGFELSEPGQEPASGHVAQDGGVAVSLLELFSSIPEIGDFFFGTTQHAALHGTDHDGVDRAPDSRVRVQNALGSRTGLQQLDDKARHQVGDTGCNAQPVERDQLFDGPVAVFELGNTGFDEGLELAGVLAHCRSVRSR